MYVCDNVSAVAVCDWVSLKVIHFRQNMQCNVQNKTVQHTFFSSQKCNQLERHVTNISTRCFVSCFWILINYTSTSLVVFRFYKYSIFNKNVFQGRDCTAQTSCVLNRPQTRGRGRGGGWRMSPRGEKNKYLNETSILFSDKILNYWNK
jgi:hypothetical protein